MVRAGWRAPSPGGDGSADDSPDGSWEAGGCSRVISIFYRFVVRVALLKLPSTHSRGLALPPGWDATRSLFRQHIARQDLARQDLARQDLARQDLARQDLARQAAGPPG